MSATPRAAIDPARSASVLASAGTGKTWLLVTRIIRLLLAGAEPGGIVAVTFTNRAAGEMRARLRERCAAFALADDETLGRLLAVIGAEDDADTRADDREQPPERLVVGERERCAAFAQPRAHLAGRPIGERDRDDAAGFGAREQQPHNARDQQPRLAGAGRREHARAARGVNRGPRRRAHASSHVPMRHKPS